MICPEFTDFLNEYDIIGLQESKLDDIDSVSINGYTIFHKNRKSCSRYRSGGITLLVRNELSSHITILRNDSKLTLWFSVSKNIMPNNSDLICGVVYIPPIGSKYAHTDPYLELQNEYDKFCAYTENVMLFGDFNSRTAIHKDFVKSDDFICEIYGNEDLYQENLKILQYFEKNEIPLERKNADITVNAYGYQLLEFCKNNNIFILNGRFNHDSSKLTCKNCSTVDYVLSTAFNFEITSSFHIADFDPLFSDAHCPLSLTIDIRKMNKDKNYHGKKSTNIPEIRLWDNEKCGSFVQNINLEVIKEIDSLLDSIIANSDVQAQDINMVVGCIEELFTSNSEMTFGLKNKPTAINKSRSGKKQWFNGECNIARNKYHKIRKLYNKYKTTHYKSLLKQVSKDYKNKLSCNYRRFKNENIAKLRNLKNSRPNEFWKIVNSLNNIKVETAPLNELYDFFKNVNKSSPSHDVDDPIEQDGYSGLGYSDEINASINQPFTEAEILYAVKNLKNNKSHGIDNIVNEHLKSTIHIMCPIYVKLFNLIFDTGIVPESWSEGNILPIYKNKGNINSAENYRPITLLSCFGKLFTAILNTRLNNFVNENDIIDSCQAGFRKGFSTTDNLFILQSLIQIAKINKSKLYCAFVDFQQAFDTVWRNGLWQKMLNTKINGKCLNFIRNMYSNIKSRIITSEGESAFFPCNTGVRQGENLSPLLFSIYLNDLQHYLHSNLAPGVICESEEGDNIVVFLKLFILLFADDTVLFSNNMSDLQTTLNIFESYCRTWKLTVNTNKTKIMIFSGGRMPKNQKFYFKGKEIEIVNEYKYLGIFLARSGSFLKAKNHIVEQANNALFSLQRKIRFLNLPIDLQFDLFNKMIKPILLYGCELWGFGNIDSIERVQLKFFKQILNLKKSTPSFMVYGELGAYPLYIDIQCRMVSFWAKLGNSGNNDIATCLYQLIHNLNEQKRIKCKWLDHIKNIITSNGYGHVWYAHDLINKKWFVQSFKQKLKDQYLQKWSSLVEQSSSGKNYRIFKDDLKINPYFAFLPNRYCRILTAFRTRNHRLPVEVGRWSSIPANERLCPLCSADIGDEYHYVMQCEFFKEQRKRYIKPYYTRNINTIKFNELMNHKSKTVIKNLCIFVDTIMKFFKDVQRHHDNI